MKKFIYTYIHIYLIKFYKVIPLIKSLVRVVMSYFYTYYLYFIMFYATNRYYIIMKIQLIF